MPEPNIHASDGQGPCRPGSRLHSYEILGQLGRGGFAYVYRARHLLFGSEVALKVIPHQDDKLALRARAEARLLMELHHPNIVRVIDGGFVEDGTIYIVMELLDGQTLRELLRESKKLEPARALRYFVQIADGVQAAHERDVIHRDLKPENVFLLGNDVIKVLDFGIAKFLGAPPITSRKDRVQGTVPYMSPEHLQGRRVTVRSDVFAMGIMLYEALHRHPLLLGEERPTMQEVVWRQMLMPPRLDEVNPAIPKRIARTVERAIARLADDRFESARAFREALENDLTWLESRTRQRSFELNSGVPAPATAAPDDTQPDAVALSGMYATAPGAPPNPTLPGDTRPPDVSQSSLGYQATERLAPDELGVPCELPSAGATRTLTPLGSPTRTPSRSKQGRRSPPRLIWAVCGGALMGIAFVGLWLVLRAPTARRAALREPAVAATPSQASAAVAADVAARSALSSSEKPPGVPSSDGPGALEGDVDAATTPPAPPVASAIPHARLRPRKTGARNGPRTPPRATSQPVPELGSPVRHAALDKALARPLEEESDHERLLRVLRIAEARRKARDSALRSAAPGTLASPSSPSPTSSAARTQPGSNIQ